MITAIIIIYVVGIVLFYNYLANDNACKDDPYLNITMAIFWLPGILSFVAVFLFALIIVVAEVVVKLPFILLHSCLVKLAKLGKELGKR